MLHWLKVQSMGQGEWLSPPIRMVKEGILV